jgi:hypothetical protein
MGLDSKDASLIQLDQ